ncbi:cilia- and flagella-associated protein 161 [Rhinatrema bivittatum]|uniref:cilia- and flagella-associated protein 161 n=1 Tax=Rhinatrema bivittatum TaxID=194408 RepID=UPI00112E9107|nr:cilia- and flagella-associated protein 161 [Rhinatrema bivittatum]
MSLKTYNPSVRIGNWNEDVYLDEDLLKDFLDKKDKGELLLQKLSNLRRNVLNKIDLSVSTDGFVHFGDVILLINPDKFRESLCNSYSLYDSVSLSANPDEVTLHTKVSLESPCAVTASKNVNPYARNSFVITSVDGSPLGEPLRYGQNFALRTSEGFMGQLYLASEQKTFLRSAKKSHLQEVNLEEQPSYLTCWQIAYLDPQLRLEYEGFPVPANKKLLIIHSKTNQCLAVLRKYVLWTFFGKEFEVTAHTYMNSHRVEEDLNHWILVTGNPSDDVHTMFDRPTPPSEKAEENT